VRNRADAELLGHVHGGCEEAAEELFRRHYPALLRYAKTLTNDSTVAEDLASEAFTRTLERVRLGAVPETLEAYLAVAVRNGSVDEFRRANRLRSLDALDETPASIGPGSPSIDCTVVLGDRDLLRQAFSALSPRHRLVLWRTTVEGRHLADVGAELGVNANAAAALAHRARAALRHAYHPAIPHAD
jgi:RNA polymerase sigma factor (sigma-70 family)